MDKKIIVYIPLNNLNVRQSLPESYLQYSSLVRVDEHLTKEWIEKRIKIFMYFTLMSLKNQTNQNFTAYVLYRKVTQPYVEQALAKYAPLPDNVRFIPSEEYENYVYQEIQGFPYFYELHLYSDDMYHKTFVDYLHNYTPKPETKVLICQNGYIYSSVKGVLAKYFNYSSSFNCLLYKTKEYLAGVRNDFLKNSDWEGAIKLPHELIAMPSYINHSHNFNAAFFYHVEKSRNKVRNVWTDNKGAFALFGSIIKNVAIKNSILKDFLGYVPKISKPYRKKRKRRILAKRVIRSNFRRRKTLLFGRKRKKAKRKR